MMGLLGDRMQAVEQTATLHFTEKSCAEAIIYLLRHIVVERCSVSKVSSGETISERVVLRNLGEGLFRA